MQLIYTTRCSHIWDDIILIHPDSTLDYNPIGMQSENKSDRYIGQIRNSSSQQARENKSKAIVKEIIQSDKIDEWRVLDQVINLILENQEKETSYSRYSSHFLASTVQAALRNMKTFSMFMFVYWLSYKKRIPGVNIHWKDYYLKICHQQQYISSFNICLSTYDKRNSALAASMQQTLLMIANVFPNFLTNERISLIQSQMDAVLYWLNEMVTQDKTHFLYACNLIKLVKQARNISLKDYEQKQHLILKKIIAILGQNENSNGSLYLFFDQFTIKQKDIEYFCHINEGFIQDLDEICICNIFNGLTKSGINKEILSLISKISNIMMSNQQYYILRIIYQRYILPILTAKLKTCRRLYAEVYAVAQFYILGFLRHCDIGLDGIQCVVKGIQEIEAENIKENWIALAICTSQKTQEYRSFLEAKLKPNLSSYLKINIEQFLAKKSIWQVTIRNGRKHKKYPQIDSKLRGISNRMNECYIISSIQSLYLTGLLYPLIQEHKAEIKEKKMQLCFELYYLFGELAGKINCKDISVKYLKQKGPDMFKESTNQQDAQHYLLDLFQSIQNEIKGNPVMYKKFNQIFMIKYDIKVTCLQCKQTISKEQSSFIHTIPHKESFKPEQTQILQSYKCDQCGKTGQCKITRSFAVIPKLLLIHLNRFSYKNGVIKKELASKPIQRVIQGKYQLVGFICHRGEDMSRGHYIYYGKIGKLRWALMNDKKVTEFNLSSEDEEFQREMKAETTPYILFYKKIGA